MRLYFMEFDTQGTNGICKSRTDDILTIKGNVVVVVVFFFSSLPKREIAHDLTECV